MFKMMEEEIASSEIGVHCRDTFIRLKSLLEGDLDQIGTQAAAERAEMIANEDCEV